MTHWQSELICTAFNRGQLPAPELPEVAFVGRSNVGKSTLINSLLNKKIAKTSSKPGKTRSLNFFSVKAALDFMLVDLPGYGYAAARMEERVGWWKLINDYFDTERRIMFVVHLIDFRHGMLDNDLELTEWLDSLDMPRQIVYTKGDKVPKGRAKQLYKKYVADGIVSIAPPLVTAGCNDSEVERLRQTIVQIIEDMRSGRL